MHFYVFAWLGVIAYGIFNIVGKLTSKYSISNPWLFTFFWTLFSLLFTIPIAIFYGVGLPHVWNNIFIAAFFNAFWFIFFTLSTYKLDVSVLSPLYNFRTVFALIFSTLLLGERLSVDQLFYFFLIFIGGIFSSVDERFHLKSFFNTSIFIAITGMLFLALNNVFVNKVFQNNGFWDGTLWMLIVTQIILIPTFPKFVKDIRKISSIQIYPLIIMSLLTVAGNIFLNIAYKTNVSITSLIAAVPASMILAFLFSVFAPKLLEKHTLKVYTIRFTGALVMIISALKLSM